MKLYLIRHGQPKSPSADPDRHLTDEGIRQSERLAEFLKPMNIKVNAIWHSNKARAQQTAQIISSAITSETGLIQQNGLSPNDTVRPLKKQLMQMETNIMIVGHLPYLSCLVSALTIGKEFPEIVSFDTASAMCLEKDFDDWTIKWLIHPQLLEQ